MQSRHSLRRKLPLLISGLLGLVVVAVSWSAYRQIESVLIVASGERLTSITLRLAGMLEQSAGRLRADAQQLAGEPALARFLAHPTAANRDSVARLLERERARAQQPVSFAVWSHDRQRLLDVGPLTSVSAATGVPAPPTAAPSSARSPRNGAWVGSLVQSDSGLSYAVVAPIVDAERGRDTLGFVVAHRRVRDGRGAAQIGGLIGSDAMLLIGNAGGGLWTDLTRQVAGPPRTVASGVPTQYTASDGRRQLGVQAPIRTTPWVLWVQVPRAAAVASAQPFVLRIAAIGLFFVALGTIGAWVVSHRVTAPLADVTRAAKDVARGDYTRRVASERRDELGSLALSFNSMAAQVEAASRDLQAHAGELELANDELRASEQRYRRLVEVAHEGICAVDLAGVITYANARLAEMLGHAPDELPGRSIFDFMDPRQGFDARTRFARRLRGIAESQEVPFRRKDGSTMWAMESVSSLTDAEGRFTGALYVLSDITESRAAAERVRSSERHFRALTEHSSDMVAVLDARGIARYVSPTLQRCTGYASEEVLDTAPGGHVHPDDLAMVQAAIARVLAGPARQVRFDYRYRHKRGGWLHLSSVATNLLDDPAVGGIVVNSRDVTEQHALEAQLLQAQKMEAIGQLAGGVAHDFNNLLTVVTSYSGMLLAELPEEEPMRADIQEIRAAADRAAALTRQLLAFSRQQVLEPRVLDVNGVVRDIESMLARLLPEHVRLETALARDLGRVYADPGQLEQVVVNLAVNARDAMPHGGALTIGTSDVELDDEYGRLHPEVRPGPYVLIAVSDTGVGMDAATQARIFEPFFTTKEVGQGTGLGLSTVYGIVKQSGGHVWVYSELGVGTTFKVYLPRATGAEGPRPARDGGTLLDRGEETILLVEDDAQVRGAARRILERAGYTVLEAANGADARRRFERSDACIDLLLTDMVMPDVSGRELATQFRARHPGAATAFMSGYTEDAVLRQGSFESGTVFIPKPFTPQTLTAKLREALAGEAFPAASERA